MSNRPAGPLVCPGTGQTVSVAFVEGAGYGRRQRCPTCERPVSVNFHGQLRKHRPAPPPSDARIKPARVQAIARTLTREYRCQVMIMSAAGGSGWWAIANGWDVKRGQNFKVDAKRSTMVAALEQVLAQVERKLGPSDEQQQQKDTGT